MLPSFHIALDSLLDVIHTLEKLIDIADAAGSLPSAKKVSIEPPTSHIAVRPFSDARGPQAQVDRLKHIAKRLEGKEPGKMSLERYAEELPALADALCKDAALLQVLEKEHLSPSIHFLNMGRPK